MAIALARKYRPRNFASVAVQSHVSDTLKGAIARGRVAHGYLLCGPRGTGKTTLARVLAMALNCERRAERDDGEPCGECASCERIWGGSASLDVVEIDAASNRGVDDARELRERAMYAPSAQDRYKVYIVDEAHMLTREAWNALLKILEEPPPRVVFVFATTDPQKIAQSAAPVLSRLQRFDLKRIGPAEIRERLAAVLEAEGVEAEPEALAIIARAADGGLRDALSLTDQVLSLGADGAVTAARVRESLGLVPEDEFLAILDLIAEGRAGDVFGAVARLADSGVDLGSFLGGVADILRAQLAVALAGDAGDVSDRLREALLERRDRMAVADLLRMLHAVAELEPRFRRSGHQQLLLETLLVRLALMDRSVELQALLRALGDGGDGGGARGGGRGSDRGGRGGDTASAGGHRGGAPDGGGHARASHGSPAPGSVPTAGRAPDAGAADWRSMMPSPSADRPVSRPDARPSGATGGGAATAMLEDAASDGGAVAVAGGGTATVARPLPSPRGQEPPPWDGPRPWDDSAATVPVAPGVSGLPDGGRDRGQATERARGDGSPGLELNHMVERWGEVAERLRADGRAMLAALIVRTPPVVVAASGAIKVEAEDEATAEGLEAGRDQVLEAVRAVFPGVKRINIRRSGSVAPRQRLTMEGVREERAARLRARDPLLARAIDALDLELLD